MYEDLTMETPIYVDIPMINDDLRKFKNEKH
jgi:hypothetical protein